MAAENNNGIFSDVDVPSITVNVGDTVTDSATGGNGALGGLGRAVIEINDASTFPGVTGDITIQGTVIDTGPDDEGVYVRGIVGGDITVSGEITAGGSGVDVADVTGRITITGTITSGSTGVETADILNGFRNQGTITGNSNGVDFSDITGGFVNSGTIEGVFGEGVDGVNILSGGFENSATIISGDDDGVDLFDITGGFRNTGTIESRSSGIDIFDIKTGDFYNSGTIQSSNSDGLELTDIETGSLINTADGKIIGSSDAIDFFDIVLGNFENHGLISGGTGEGIDAFSIEQGDFINHGIITSTENNAVDFASDIDNGDFINTNQIIGGLDGIEARDIGGELRNEGTIQGITEYGIQLEPGSLASTNGFRLINTSTGTITGNLAAFISDEFFFSSNESITNAGTINGDVILAGGDDQFALTTTGVLNGAVDGGPGTDTLIIDSASSGTRNLTSGVYSSFETIDLNQSAGATGQLNLSGANAVDAGTGVGSSITLHRGFLNLGSSSATSVARAETISINSPSTLFGEGTLNNGSGGTNIFGTISPGNSIGTINVAGNYIQSGAYEVEFQAPSAPYTFLGGSVIGTPGVDSDLIAVTGIAIVTGGSVILRPLSTNAEFETVFLAPGNTNNEIRYTILTAGGGVNGNYAVLTTGGASLVHNANNIELVIDDTFDSDVVMTPDPPIALVNEQSSLWAQVVAKRERPRCDLEVFGIAQNGSCGFASGSFSHQEKEETSSFEPGSENQISEGILGGGVEVSDNIWLGAALGAGTMNLDSDDSAESDATVYSGYLWGQALKGYWDLRGWLSVGYYDVEGDRTTLLNSKAEYDYTVWAAEAAFEARRWIELGELVKMTPRIDFSALHFNRESFSESGGSIENFNADSEDGLSLQSLLGLEVLFIPALFHKDILISGYAAWLHEYGDRYLTVSGTFEGDSATELSRETDELGADSVSFGLSALFPIQESIALRLSYDGNINDDINYHKGMLRFSVGF